MKFAAEYSATLDCDSFDEIIVPFSEPTLEDLLQAHTDKRIIIAMQEEDLESIGAINRLYRQYNNIVVRIYNFREWAPISDSLLSFINSLETPFFFGYKVTNYEQLQYLFTLGISDVYLAEEICFDLWRVKQLCKKYNVSIRVFPDVAQSSVPASAAHKKFFVRPEDTSDYEDVVDIFEFWSNGRANILCKIYKKQLWPGDLQDLITDLSISLDSKSILDGWALVRKRCEKRCLKGGICAVCDRVLEISQKAKEEKELFIDN